MFSTLLMMFTSGQPEKSPCESDGQEHIQKVDENYFLIDREYVSYYVRNTNEAKDFGRVRWHKNVKGDIDGFKLYRIKCESPLYKAGLRNKDLLTPVDGTSIDSYGAALAVWFRMKFRKKFTVDIVRKREQITLHYEYTTKLATNNPRATKEE